MMQEKAMVSDALNSINSGLKTYTDMISQTENQELRSVLQQMRNESETSQFELYSLAKNLHYYQPAQKANQDEINSLKSIFSQSTWAGSSSGMSGNSVMGSSSGMSSGSSVMGSSSGMSSGSSSVSAGSSGKSSLSGGTGMSAGSPGKSSGLK